jgi:hypothetical protein
MLKRPFLGLLLLAAATFACNRAFGADQREACPTTRPPDPPFVPPPPYPTDMGSGTFWYGSESLWTTLELGGTWKCTSRCVERLMYWRRGYNWRTEPEPQLTVTARRLDRKVPSVTFHGGTNFFVLGQYGRTAAMMSGIDIPTAGCWEVTARYRGDTLSFIVSVEP